MDRMGLEPILPIYHLYNVNLLTVMMALVYMSEQTLSIIRDNIFRHRTCLHNF